MSDTDFSLVEAALIEPNLGTLRALRDALVQLGVRKAHPFPGVTGLIESLTAVPSDLVMVNVDLPDNEGFRIIRWLRNDPVSPNPFVCIIATTWKPTEALLTRVNNSGADIVLVKPASPRQVMDRVAGLITGRKRFVVTADYIGPDRRKNPREGVQIPTFDGPNTLRLKAAGQWDRIASRDLVTKGIAWLNEQKSLRNAFQIAFLIEFALNGLARTPPERVAFEHLMRVPAVIEDLRRRAAGREVDARLETAAKALWTLVERIRRHPDHAVAATELTQMQSLALGLLRFVNPARSPDSLIKEVTESAQAYRKRLDQLRAAKAAQEAEAAPDAAAPAAQLAS